MHTQETVKPQPLEAEELAVGAVSDLPERAGRELDSALAANRLWREWRRRVLERKIRKARQFYHWSFPVGAGFVWLDGWVIDQCFFGGTLLSWDREPVPGSPEHEFANAYSCGLTMGLFLVGMTCCGLATLWELRLRDELAELTDAESEAAP